MALIYANRVSFLAMSLLWAVAASSQSNPAITAWLRNTNGQMAKHYVKGNSTVVNDADSANVQNVYYSGNYVYVRATGLPAYATGPFLDGNPSLASNQKAIFKFPLSPVKKTGTSTNTTGGNIGVFINGVALFDYRDAYSWKNSTSTVVQGGGDGKWNRDAIVGETKGFDCSKGHPAMGNYHHHQNPSAFKYDLTTLSAICNTYNADGLYVLDSTKHSPLIGFAYDGFPIYGGYAYKNVDGSGGITRMKSSYNLRNITKRTAYADGTVVLAGPDVNSTYYLGYFREDYQYVATSTATPDYLDDHNGRFCVTPEYPNGIYCYFATVDSVWHSAYPYAVGPTFYGVVSASKVTSITETVKEYLGTTLAINLKSFDAFVDDNKTLLTWETTGANPSGFIIERSKDGKVFSAIGTLTANEGTAESNFRFTDKSPFAGRNIYRIKINAKNAEPTYSNSITVINRGQDFGARIYPNPSTDMIVVQANDFLTEDAQLLLVDLQGRLVQTKILAKGSTLGILETQKVYPGDYMVKIITKGLTKVYKVTIRK